MMLILQKTTDLFYRFYNAIHNFFSYTFFFTSLFTVKDDMRQTIRNTLGPFSLIFLCPPFAILMWYTNTALNGSFYALWEKISEQGLLHVIYDIWRPIFFGSTTAWTLLLSFAVFQLALMRILPGKIFKGPTTPTGQVPKYKANGVLAFITTLSVFCLSTFYFHFFSATLIYDEFGSLLGALNLFSLVFCTGLYLKGRFYPSSADAGLSGNVLFDFYWGTELFPRILGWDLKMFVTCRMGMMSWGLILISYAAKQNELYGLSDAMLVSIALQLFYITKFYIWETGYLSSLDIMHDRAGFYICWGCLFWVPCIYTSPAMYLVLHPIHLGTLLASTIFILGTISISINFLADRQRQAVRGGKKTVWGKSPIIVTANYKTSQGEEKQSLLLASGWWGITRHFHYLPEILGAFFWSMPALFYNFSPYFYVCFLTILLVDRAYRDDKRCAKKYGQDWKAYCKLVPYKLIPYFI